MGVRWPGKFSFIIQRGVNADRQLFIDYIDTVTEIPALLKESLTTGAYSSRLTKLSNDLPRILRLLPALFPNTENVQQVACLSDMLSALHHLAGQLSLANLVSPPCHPCG